MARPTKKGLDYFAFDVDFFADGKILAVSKEFGVKGEVVAVRLLCAIYREGYFMQWDETSRVKLGMGLPSVSDALLEQIVRGLVRWGFFDKGLFDSAGVLTSRGIQRRYFASVRRRKGEAAKLPYLLLGKGELLQAETQLLQAETQLLQAETPKVKESKDYKEKKKEKKDVEKNLEEQEWLSAESVMKLYNQAIRAHRERVKDEYGEPLCRLSEARVLLDGRRERLEEIGKRYSEDQIKIAFWNACGSAYCNGRRKERRQRADLDWMIQEKNFVRLLENTIG